MRLTDEEQTGVWAAPDPTPTPDPLSGGAWPAAQGGSISRGESDGLGHYWDSNTQAWRNENDNSLYGSSAPSQPLSGGAWPAAQSNTSDGLGHYWDSTTQQWMNDSGGAYAPNDYGADPGLGVYGDQGSYQTPLQGGAWPAAQQTQSYPEATQPPAFAPDSWSQPQPADAGYNAPSPNAYSPWDAANQQPQSDYFGRFGGASGATSLADKGMTLLGDLGTALSAPQQYVGGPIAQAAWDNPLAAASFIANPIGGLQSLGVNAATNPQGAVDTYKSAYDANQNYLNDPNANPYLKAIYRTGTDPLTYLGPEAAAKLLPEGGKIGAIGRSLIDQGGIPAVFGANLGQTAAVDPNVGGQVPYFKEQPAWLRGLEGAVGGGVGAAAVAGTLKNAARDIAKGGYEDVAPSIYKPSPFRVGEEAQYPPSVARELPQGRAIPQLAGGADETLNDTRRTIMDALDNELQFRKTGEAEAIKAAKRGEQVAGINAATPGATSAETLANVSAGAKVGKFFDKTAGLDIPEPQYNAALTDILSNTQGYDTLGTVKALSKLKNGDRLTPGEIKTLGKYYGSEFAQKVEQVNAGRIQTVAELTSEDIAKINQNAVIDGRRVATLEVQATRQHELADNLLKQSNMDPTNPRLKKAVEDARARAIQKENQANQIMADRAEKATANLPERTAAQISGAEAKRYGSVDEALRHDKALAAQEAAVRKAAEDEWVKGLTEQPTDPFAATQARNEARGIKQLSAAQEAAKKAAGDKAAAEWANSLDFNKPDQFAKTAAGNEARAMKELGQFQDTAYKQQYGSTATAEWKASGQKALSDAEKAIDKMPISPELKAAHKKALEIGFQQDGAVLDGLGDAAPSILRQAYAAATGEVTDSWTSAMLSRKAFIENALQQQGMDAQSARVIGKFVQDAEVKRRYGLAPPQHVLDSLDQAKGVERDAAGKAINQWGQDNIIHAAATFSQEFKNTMFGPLDVGVFGQQGLKTLLTSTPQFVTGLANRIASLAYKGIDTSVPSVDELGKKVAYSLDGLSHSGATGVVDASNGTLLSLIPGLKTFDRRVLTPWVDLLTNLQFKHVLGNMRDITHEGNLVLSKLAGADITDPIVRQQSAKWANVATGAGTLAQRANRASLEKATLLSASMTRAQAQQGGLIIRGLNAYMKDARYLATFGKVAKNLDASARVDRVLAAATIVSTVGTTLGIGKLLNDWVGTEPFDFDPSSKGFGYIRLPDGTSVNLFSQMQIPKAFAQSLGVLKKDGVTQSDLGELGKIWGNLAQGRSSPALRLGEAAVGIGYEPGRGYRYGDYMEGKSVGQRLVSQLPIPPLITQTQQDGLSPLNFAANATGVNAYPESPYSALDRKLIADPAFGKPRDQLSEAKRFEADQKYGRVLSSDPKIAAQQQQGAELVQMQTDRQNARDAELQQNGMTPDNWRTWRDQRKKDNLYFAGRFDQLYQGVDFKDKNVTDVDRYYKAIADNTDRVTGDVNWDAVDAATKNLDQAYIKANTNLRDTGTEKVYHDAVNQIADTGYFDREKQAWQKVASQLPKWNQGGVTANPADYQSYDEWRTAALNDALRISGKTPSDVGTVTQINAWLDKQEPSKGDAYYASQWKDQWVAANPREAYLAWQMGYYNPKKEIKAWLAKKFE